MGNIHESTTLPIPIEHHFHTGREQRHHGGLRGRRDDPQQSICTTSLCTRSSETPSNHSQATVPSHESRRERAAAPLRGNSSAAAVVEPNNDSVTDDANVLMKLQAITAKCQLYATISKPDYIREHEKQTKRTIAALEGLVSTAEAKLALLVKDQPAIAASDDETTKVFRRVDGEWQEQEDVSEEDTLKVDLEQLQQEFHRQKGLAEMDAVMTADALKEDITRCQAWVQNKLQ